MMIRRLRFDAVSLCFCLLLCGTIHSQSLVPLASAAAMVDRSIISITSSIGEHSHHLCVLSYDELPRVQQVCEGIDSDDPHSHRYNDRVEGYELRVSYSDNEDYNYDDFMRVYEQHAVDGQQQQKQKQKQQQQDDVVRIKLSVQVKIASVSDFVKVLNGDVDR